MANDLAKIATQGKDLWNRLTPRRRLLVVAGVVVTAAAIYFFSREAKPSYAVLFSGLSTSDAGEVVAALQEQKIPYRLDAGGTAISVPEGREHELRLSLAQRGVPRGGGVGFEIFDKERFGQTSFGEQLNYRRALQGELQRTIGALDVVAEARVHLAFGERSLYKKEEDPPSASVVLKLRNGRKLSPPQVAGIVHLVAASVPGLDPDRVTVVDERGVVLSRPDTDASGMEGERELEQLLARRVTEILEPFVGKGRLAVAVTAEMDRSQVERTEELYDKDRTALRSESRTEELDPAAAATGGIAGARGNLPGAPAPTPAAGQNGLMRLQETKNYEVNRITSHTVDPRARVKRITIALLVDGVPDASGKIVPRAQAELARIEALAREAAGLDAARGDRISVQSAPFSPDANPAAEDPAAEAAKNASKLPSIPVLAAAGGGVLVLAALAVFLILRSRRRSQKKRAPQLLPSLPATVGQLEAELPAVPALPARTRRDEAIEAAQKDGLRAARVLSAWLAESPADPVHAPARGGA